MNKRPLVLQLPQGLHEQLLVRCPGSMTPHDYAVALLAGELALHVRAIETRAGPVQLVSVRPLPMRDCPGCGVAEGRLHKADCPTQAPAGSRPVARGEIDPLEDVVAAVETVTATDVRTCRTLKSLRCSNRAIAAQTGLTLDQVKRALAA